MRAFPRRMFDPRAEYNPIEPKASRAWWIAFGLGILVFGIVTLIAIIMVWHDKKYLKQMALALVYMGTPAVVFIFVMVAATAVDDLSLFAVIFVSLGGPSFIVGILLAFYAQRRIDRDQPDWDDKAAASEAKIKALHDADSPICVYEGCSKTKAPSYVVCVDHLCDGCVSGKDPCGLCCEEEHK